MKHSFLDRYSEGDSLLHRLDPRTKILSTVFFIVAVVLTPLAEWASFALYFFFLLTLMFLSRVPLAYLFRHSLTVMPFVILVAMLTPFSRQGEVIFNFHPFGLNLSVTDQGLFTFETVLARAWLSVQGIVLLVATTKMTDILKGLAGLRLPGIIVMILSFMYRYLFILTDEVMRLKRARDSRNFARGHLFPRMKTVGRMAGTLFLRSYERGERVYAAMLARGYDGRIPGQHELCFARTDAVFLISISAALIAAWGCRLLI